MKKLLLLLAGLLFAVLPSKAQETESTSYRVSEVGITKVEALTEGDYIIYAVPGGTGKNPAYVGYRDNNDDSKGKVFIKPGLDVSTGEVSDVNYIWTVTKDTEGNISIALKSAPEEKFWTKDSKWGNNMSGTDKAIYIPENNDGTNTGISLRLKDIIKTGANASTTSPAYVCCNLTNTSNEYCLSYWEGKPGSTKFTFYKLQEKTDNYPFICSDAPTAEGFSPNTYWYYMTVREKYVTHDEKLDYCPASATNPVNYGSFWAFVKNEAGQIEIYNAATGPNYVLASNTPTGDGGSTCPIMKEKNTLTDTEKGVWNIKHTGSDNFFFLNFPDVNNAYMNYREPKLAFWVHANSYKDDGSKLKVQEVDINTLINTVREQQSAVTGAVGTLVGESYADFTAALNKGTIEGLVEALKIRDLTGTTVQFNVNNAYYLFAYASASATKYMQINNEATLNSGNKQTDNASIIWKFSGDENNGYKISGQGKYLNKVTSDSQNVPTVSNEDAAALYNLMKVPNKAAAFYIRPTDGKGLHIASNGQVVGWNEGGGSEWYLIEAPSIDIAISSAGYATVNYPFAVQLPEGLTAYTGTANPEKSKFMLKEVPNGAVPANTPVVVEGTEGTYPLTIDYENTAERINSDLSGNLLPIEITPNDYILAKDANDIVGFYKTSDGGTLAQNKAYIKSTSAIQGVRGFGFSTEGDGTTGIENTVTETEKEEYYDLQGRRILNPTKGIYVTKSGKKVLFIK